MKFDSLRRSTESDAAALPEYRILSTLLVPQRKTGCCNTGLSRLPELKSLWNVDKEDGIISFGNLKEARVSEGPKLGSLLPASIASGLAKLESVNIVECGLEWIVAKGDEVIGRFVFPEVAFLKLCGLLKLEGLYPPEHAKRVGGAWMQQSGSICSGKLECRGFLRGLCQVATFLG
ncbi:hypothetical protein CDL15_Pgr022029 [Punica granatum]|nr:hypothetical protein CDL15_Pgr022029 [Punica granatum]